MKKQIYDEKNGMSYTLHGDYYLPDLFFHSLNLQSFVFCSIFLTLLVFNLTLLSRPFQLFQNASLWHLLHSPF